MFILSPLLVDLATEFGVSIGQAGLLVAAATLPGATVVLVAGPLSDAFGRRALLVGGTAVLAVGSLVSAVATSYEVMVLSRLLAGVGFAAAGPSIFAAVGDLFPYQERGRAFGYLVGANTLSLLLGVPMATVLAAVVDWRLSFAVVGLSSAAAVLLLGGLYRAGPGASLPSAGDETSERTLSAILASSISRYALVWHDQSGRAVLGSSLAMSTGWMGFQTYLGALFITRYGIDTGALAPIFGLAGLGNFIGSQIGGHLGDRVGHKPIMSLSVLVAGAFVLMLGYMPMDLIVATAINFVLSIPMGMRFTSASTVISEAVPQARATMSAFNMAAFNGGTTLGAFLGSIVVEQAGYSALTLLTAAGCVVSGAVVGAFVKDQRGTPPAEELAETQALRTLPLGLG